MTFRTLVLAVGGALTLSACATTREEVVAPAPPLGPGAMPGTVAADRDGDGIADGYYTPDGLFHPFQAPPCPPPPPPPPPTPRGERG
jgi:hypothetical protein